MTDLHGALGRALPAYSGEQHFRQERNDLRSIPIWELAPSRTLGRRDEQIELFQVWWGWRSLPHRDLRVVPVWPTMVLWSCRQENRRVR